MPLNIGGYLELQVLRCHMVIMECGLVCGLQNLVKYYMTSTG